MNLLRARIAQAMASQAYKAQLDTLLFWISPNGYEGFEERAKVEQEVAALCYRVARQAMGLEATK
jgi:hypothetical protein